MPRFHGAFSVGGLCGAGLGALAAALGLAVGAHLALAAMAVVVTALIVARHLPDLAGAPRHQSPSRARHAAGDHPEARAARPAHGVHHARRGRCRRLGGDLLHRRAQRQGVGSGDRLCRHSPGRWRSAGSVERGCSPGCRASTPCAASGVLASVSVLALVAVDSTATGLIAMIGWGSESPLVFPAAMSAGAENAHRPAQGIATVATIGYGGFLVGPPMIGFVAGAAGLGAGLFIVSLLLLFVVDPRPGGAPARSAEHAGPRRAPCRGGLSAAASAADRSPTLATMRPPARRSTVHGAGRR